jgi:hypothetical protein
MLSILSLQGQVRDTMWVIEYECFSKALSEPIFTLLNIFDFACEQSVGDNCFDIFESTAELGVA